MLLSIISPGYAELTLSSAQLSIEYVPVAVLKPPKRNARTHSKKQIRQIAGSVRRYGFNGAIVIDESNVVLVGNGRWAAARELELETVPCIRITGLTEAAKRAYAITDNKVALNAGWDMEVLASELGELAELDYELADAGFDQAELDAIFAAAAEASTQPDAPEDRHFSPPVEGSVVTRIGDLWLLGRHRLLCGDSKSAADVDRVMDGDKAGMVFGDPPYNQKIAGNVSGLGKVQHREFAEASGEMSPDQFEAFLYRTNVEIERSCRNGAIVYLCMDWRHLQEALAAGYRVYSDLKNLCVWAKTNAGMGTFYRSQHELIMVWKVGDQPHTNNFGLGDTGRHRTNLWTYAGVNSFRAGRMEELSLHPTVKPVALVADAIRDVTKRGEIVFDPFGGSGTTLIAAQKTGRTAHMIEIDPAYCDVIVRRWQTLTGKRAVLEGGGDDFEAVQEARAITQSVQAEVGCE